MAHLKLRLQDVHPRPLLIAQLRELLLLHPTPAALVLAVPDARLELLDALPAQHLLLDVPDSPQLFVDSPVGMAITDGHELGR